MSTTTPLSGSALAPTQRLVNSPSSNLMPKPAKGLSASGVAAKLGHQESHQRLSLFEARDVQTPEHAIDPRVAAHGLRPGLRLAGPLKAPLCGDQAQHARHPRERTAKDVLDCRVRLGKSAQLAPANDRRVGRGVTATASGEEPSDQFRATLELCVV